jgi:hypothetical protein
LQKPIVRNSRQVVNDGPEDSRPAVQYRLGAALRTRFDRFTRGNWLSLPTGG